MLASLMFPLRPLITSAISECPSVPGSEVERIYSMSLMVDQQRSRLMTEPPPPKPKDERKLQANRYFTYYRGYTPAFIEEKS